MTGSPGMSVIFCDQSEVGFGWISREPDWMGRASHALRVDGGVWLVDPVDFAGLDERIGSLGSPRAVLQLLDRHNRDSAAISARLAVPLHITPAAVPDAPFEMIPIDGPGRWRETALWWPERRMLIVAEALGTARFYRAPRRPLGVHALLRLLWPPAVLLRFEPDDILCGHGRGVHADAAAALRAAVRDARRELPAMLPRVLGARRHAFV